MLLRRIFIKQAQVASWNGVCAAAPTWLLVFTLLWVESLGLWHGIVHKGGYGSLQQSHQAHDAHEAHDTHDMRATRATHEAATVGDTAPRETGFFQLLFGDHHGGADCRLFDQLSHGDALRSVATVALSLATPAVPTFYGSGLASVRWRALFRVRAPPSVR